MTASLITRLKPLADWRARLSSSGAKQPAKHSALAVDFGDDALRVLQLTASGALHGATCVETPALEPLAKLEWQLANLAALIRSGGFKGKRAVCSVPSWMTTVQRLQVAKSEGVDAQQAIDGAIIAQTGFEPGELVYKIFDASRTDNAEVLMLAAERRFVDRLLKGLCDAKLEPVGMQSEFTALVHGFEPVFADEAQAARTSMCIDIDASDTKLVIMRGAELLFARSIEIGANKLTPGSSDQQPSHDSAPLSDNLLHMTGELNPAAPWNTESVEILTDEILMSMRYHAGSGQGRRIDRVLFTGRGACAREMCIAITRRLRLPAFIADPFAAASRKGCEVALGVDPSIAHPDWAVAFGLAVSPTDL